MNHLEIILCIMPSTSFILQPPTGSPTELALKGEQVVVWLYLQTQFHVREMHTEG
jgi:hypothetical protein